MEMTAEGEKVEVTAEEEKVEVKVEVEQVEVKAEVEKVEVKAGVEKAEVKAGVKVGAREEQLEEEKSIALSIRVKPLNLDGMDSDELKEKARTTLDKCKPFW